MIYIVIPVFNRWAFTQSCLRSLSSQTYRAFNIIVVDHGSTDGTSHYISAEFPDVTVIKGDESMWWTAATNLGVQYALMQPNTSYILTLNNDLIVESNYLESLVNVASQFSNTLVGSISVNKDFPEKVIFAGVRWNKWTAKFRPTIKLNQYEALPREKKTIDTDLLPGRGTLIPVPAFKKNGLFDSIRFPHYTADEDFSLRCKKNGYKLTVSRSAVVYSEVNATTGLNNIHQKKGGKYWIELLTSIRSPVSLKRRWYWARLNTPLPPIYFLIDIVRIVGSKIRNH